jgi:hypothetical protein
MRDLVAREVWPSYFAPVIDLETSAIRIHEWEMRVVPGLLHAGPARQLAELAHEPGMVIGNIRVLGEESHGPFRRKVVDLRLGAGVSRAPDSLAVLTSRVL